MSLSQSERARILSAARRETIDGLLVLHLSGSPFELGLQHGALCRAEIHAFRRLAFHYLSTVVAAGLRLPAPLARRLTRPLMLLQARRYLPFVSQEHRDELRGVAQGAGVHMLEALLVNAIWELYIAHGCSQFAVRGRRSLDGQLLHGYNYDLVDPAHAFVGPYLALMFVRPDRGAAFAQVNITGCIGVNGGLSSAGLSVAWDNALLRPGSHLLQGAPPFCTPFQLALRTVLQHASCIEEGLELMRQHLPRPTADTIILSHGGTQRALAAEMAGRQLVVRQMQDDALWSANSFVSPELGPEDRHGVPGPDLEETGSRLGRYASYTERLVLAQRPLDVAGAAAVLRDPYPREQHGYRYPATRRDTICRAYSAFSLVMQPHQGRIWVSAAPFPAPHNRMLGFELASEALLEGSTIPPTGYQAAVRGYELAGAGQLDQALEALQQALALDGPSIPLQLLLAQLYQARGDGVAASRYRSLVLAAGLQPGDQVPFPSAIKPLMQLTV